MYEKGEKVYLLRKARGGIPLTMESVDKLVIEGVVVTVGSKYVTVKPSGAWEEKFEIANGYRQVCDSGSADYRLFKTREKAVDTLKQMTLFRELRKMFDYNRESGYTLSQLKRVKEILDEKE